MFLRLLAEKKYFFQFGFFIYFYRSVYLLKNLAYNSPCCVVVKTFKVMHKQFSASDIQAINHVAKLIATSRMNFKCNITEHWRKFFCQVVHGIYTNVSLRAFSVCCSSWLFSFLYFASDLSQSDILRYELSIGTVLNSFIDFTIGSTRDY